MSIPARESSSRSSRSSRSAWVAVFVLYLGAAPGAALAGAAEERRVLEVGDPGASISTDRPEVRSREGRLVGWRSEAGLLPVGFPFPNLGDETVEVLFELAMDVPGYGSNHVATAVGLELSMDSGNSGRLFGDLELTPADVGTTFYADARSYRNAFRTASRKLTDGLDGRFNRKVFLFPTSGSSTASYPESFLFGDLPGGHGVDFFGFRIDSIALRLDSLTMESPGSDPNGDGQWTDVTAAATVFFLYDLVVFADGFESGDLSGWSFASP